MTFVSPSAVAFKVFNYQVRWYGICMFFAILCGILVILQIAKKFYKEYSEDFLLDLALVLILSGILGARLYYVILDYKYFLKFPLEIFAVWQGGLSIHGAILGAMIAGGIFVRKKGFDFLKTADLCSFGLVSGQIIGRWGNFFNSEAFGLPCNLPWKLYIPIKSRPLSYLFYNYFHPTFLYESIGSLVILIVLLVFRFKNQEIKPGTIFFLYLTLYSALRIVIESFRIDSVLSFGNLHIAHIVSAIMFLIGLLGLFFIRKSNKG